VLRFLATSYWAAPSLPEDRRVELSIRLLLRRVSGGQQIGFARVTTDYALIAYINDIFILEPFQGQELAQWLIRCIAAAHPRCICRLRRFLLTTRDAQGLPKVGFTPLVAPNGGWVDIHITDAAARAIKQPEAIITLRQPTRSVTVIEKRRIYR